MPTSNSCGRNSEGTRQELSAAGILAGLHALNLFNGGSDAIFVHRLCADGSMGRFLDVNDTACKKLGYTREELLRLQPSDVDAICPSPAVLRHLLEAGHELREGLQISKDGGRIPVEVCSRIFDDDGTLTVVSSVRDITERKEAAAKRDLLEKQLVQARELETIGRIAGSVAHDFNNILTAILGYSGLLTNGLKDGDPMRSYATEIQKAAERAVQLSMQLTVISGQRVIAPVAMDLNQTIRDAAPLIQCIIGRVVRLETKLDDTLEHPRADANQIYRVIVNLAMNARQAISGAGLIVIETRNITICDKSRSAHGAGATPGNFILMTVIDNGQGMTEETRAQIFEPFFTTGKGTGLGLSIVRGIVQDAGGWIDVTSELGIGTSFSVYLPRDAAGAAR